MQAMTIGGATVDIIVSGADCDHGIGNKHNVDAITLGIGGGAVNASLALRASGVDVRIVCALGDDREAEWIRSALRCEHIDLSLTQSISSHSTGKAVIHLDEKAEATVFTQRGASTLVSPARALDARKADLLYVTAISPQSESELARVLYSKANWASRFVINPGMDQLKSSSAAFFKILSRADIIFLNESEARMLASRKELSLPDETQNTPASLLSQLKFNDRQAILVTLGDRGAMFYDGSDIHFSAPAHAPIRSTLGAGDAFCATFSSYWARDFPVQAALKAARTYCSSVLQSTTANLAKT